MKRPKRIGSVYPKPDGSWEAALGSGKSRATHRVATEADGWIWCAQEYARRMTLGDAPTPPREIFAERFTAAEMETRLAATNYSDSTKTSIRSTAAWIRTACADLLTVPMPERYGEERIIKRAIVQIFARRAAPAPDRKTASALISLVGRWEVRDGALFWNGAEVAIKNTAPRMISLAAGVRPGDSDLAHAPHAAHALDLLAAASAPMSENALGRDAVKTLARRGLLKIEIAAVRDARSAILALMERSPRREAEIGTQAARTLILKRYAVRNAATAYALRSAKISPRARGYLNATIALAVQEEGGRTWLPPQIGYGDRGEQEISRLAAMSGAERPVERDLRSLLNHLIACAGDGDPLDRLLALEAALGLRQSEARGLNVGDLDGATLTINRHRLESSRLRRLKTTLANAPMSLTPTMATMLQAWCIGRSGDESLVGADHLSNAAINRRRDQRIKEIGLRPTLYATDLRHLAATLLEEAGADKDRVRRFLRHEEGSKATKRYTERMERTIPAESLEMILGG